MAGKLDYNMQNSWDSVEIKKNIFHLSTDKMSLKLFCHVYLNRNTKYKKNPFFIIKPA